MPPRAAKKTPPATKRTPRATRATPKAQPQPEATGEPVKEKEVSAPVVEAKEEVKGEDVAEVKVSEKAPETEPVPDPDLEREPEPDSKAGTEQGSCANESASVKSKFSSLVLCWVVICFRSNGIQNYVWF